MARTFFRQDTQIRQSDVFDDTLASGSLLESASSSIESDLNALRSQAKRALFADAAGDWFADVPTTNGKKRGLQGLNADLDDLEEQKVMCRVSVLTDIVVPAGQNFKILGVTASEAPTQVAAVAGTQDGAVVAKSALSGVPYEAHELIEIAGANAITPKNMCVVVDGATGQVAQSAGRDIFGLLQYESTGTDGLSFNDTSAGRRAKISFVRLNATRDDLEACPVVDIATRTIRYAYTRRLRFDDLPEECWLHGHSFVDHSTQVDVTRQRAYTNQGTTPVDVTTNSFLDLEAASIKWAIRDNNEAELLSVIEGSAGGTSEIHVRQDVDIFNVDAIVNDFANGIRVGTAVQELRIGSTAGVIESTGANDLRFLAAAEMFLDDGNQTGSTWAQNLGVKLSETTAEWSDFETEFGEVSLLRALVLAKTTGGGGGSSRGTKTYTAIVGTINENTNVSIGVDMSAGSFLTDYDVFFNGQLLRPGVDLNADHDYYPGTSLAAGQIRFEFKLKVGDTICVVPYTP